MLNLMIVHLFGLMTPGPDFFYVTRMAASNSRRNVISGIIGITLGVAFWAASAILGLAILLKTTPMLQGVIMLLGGGYLMYLGYLMLKSRTNATFEPVSDEELNNATTVKKEIMKGLLVNLSNAKAIIYFASVMSYILVTLNQMWQMIIAFSIIVIETFLYFYLLSVLFSRPLAKHFYSRYSRYIDNAAGIIFLLFGGFLMYNGVMELGIGS